MLALWLRSGDHLTSSMFLHAPEFWGGSGGRSVMKLRQKARRLQHHQGPVTDTAFGDVSHTGLKAGGGQQAGQQVQPSRSGQFSAPGHDDIYAGGTGDSRRGFPLKTSLRPSHRHSGRVRYSISGSDCVEMFWSAMGTLHIAIHVRP